MRFSRSWTGVGDAARGCVLSFYPGSSIFISSREVPYASLQATSGCFSLRRFIALFVYDTGSPSAQRRRAIDGVHSIAARCVVVPPCTLPPRPQVSFFVLVCGSSGYSSRTIRLAVLFNSRARSAVPWLASVRAAAEGHLGVHGDYLYLHAIAQQPREQL